MELILGLVIAFWSSIISCFFGIDMREKIPTKYAIPTMCLVEDVEKPEEPKP